MNKFILILGFLSMTACATRTVKILDASWTSMKNKNPPLASEKLKKIGPVSTEYCMESWSGSYGLMDEAVAKAERSDNLDYIKDPSFTKSEGRDCVQLSGEGYRIVR